LAVNKQKNEPREEVSFGQQFKMLRAQRGISLKTVSDETRIAVATLRLIEEEAYDKLPDAVFVKGFLRAYAKMIGADADRVIQDYLSGRHHYYQSLQFEANLLRRGRSFWPRLILSVGLFACIILASIAMLRNHIGDYPPEAAVPPPETTLETVTAPIPEPDVRSPVAPKEMPGGYLLQIDAVEETRLKVIIDRHQPKQYGLNPGDQLELKATSGFNLLIGNATGIRLRLNHQPVVIEGRRGQVVTLKLP
jgi:cytoskeleton protein RodZ